jgi:hypothetical protein
MAFLLRVKPFLRHDQLVFQAIFLYRLAHKARSGQATKDLNFRSIYLTSAASFVELSEVISSNPKKPKADGRCFLICGAAKLRQQYSFNINPFATRAARE